MELLSPPNRVELPDVYYREHNLDHLWRSGHSDCLVLRWPCLLHYHHRHSARAAVLQDGLAHARALREDHRLRAPSLIANIFWLILAGLPMAISYAVLGVLYCITVIGIPIGLQCLKMAKLSLLPFGAQVR